MNKQIEDALKMAIEAMRTCDLETETWSVVDIALATHACKEALEQSVEDSSINELINALQVIVEHAEGDEKLETRLHLAEARAVIARAKRARENKQCL